MSNAMSITIRSAWRLVRSCAASSTLAHHAGYAPLAASELEFFLYRDTYRAAHDKGYTGLVAAGWYVEDYHLLQGSAGRGLRRRGAARAPRLRGPCRKFEGRGSDRAARIEYSLCTDPHDGRPARRDEAGNEGTCRPAGRVSVTFMAKPHHDQSGSSCHIHLSLWSGEGEGAANLFSDGTAPH